MDVGDWLQIVLVCFLGAFFIAYVGFRTLTFANTLSNKEINLRSGSAMIIFKGAAEGFLVSLFNPKIALFFLAIFSHFVKPNGGLEPAGVNGPDSWINRCCVVRICRMRPNRNWHGPIS